MKILVTTKRVTDPGAKIKLKADGSGIAEEGVEYKPNPFCENAIEAAIQLQEKHGGEVVVVSIGPKEAAETIRGGLAMGADRGIRIEGLDTELDGDLVARAFAKLVEREKPDIFLLGKQAIDGDSNQVGQLLAEYLGWPQATFASKIELVNGGAAARVAREVDGGIETIEVDLPAVITADLRLNEPRFQSLPNIMKSKRKPLDTLTFAELGVDTKLKVRVTKFEAPSGRLAGQKVADVATLVAKLQNEAKVL